MKTLNLIITILFILFPPLSFSKAESFTVINSSKETCTSFSENLKYGNGIKNIDLKLVKFGPDSKLAKVIELQNFLIEDGYLSGEATGYFGVKTLSAVKKYQKANSIKATGFVGEITRGVMRSVSCPDAGSNSGEVTSTNCKSWFDGCNNCSRGQVGGPAMCTLMACLGEQKKSFCREYFTTKTCTEGGKVYKEGESVSCLTQKDQVNKACIADAAYVCRDGVWKIEGSMWGI